MSNQQPISTFLGIAAAVMLATKGHADIINVPADQPTIQAGINAAVNGDEVVVADGVYTGLGNKNLDFQGKQITLRSANGHGATIIDLEDNGRAFIFQTGETSLARVEGFTIMNGDGSGQEGGAVRILLGSPTLIDLVFVDNVSVGLIGGGAIYVEQGDPIVRRCTFQGGFSAFGGGISTRGSSSVLIEDCDFIDNRATVRGAGVSVSLGSTAELRRCRFLGNLGSDNGANGDGAGAAVWADAEAHFVNCLFSGNRGRGEGGGAYVEGSIASFVNCTFSHNSLIGGFTNHRGGGLAVRHPTQPVSVENCVFWGNTDISSTVEGKQISSFFLDVDLKYSDIEGLSGLYGGVGNLGLDPQFVDAAGPDGTTGTFDDDLHLLEASPAVNAGDPTFAGTGERDLDGEARVQICRVDMGVDETPFFLDCNGNDQPDACDTLEGDSADCNGNGLPDECEPDCNTSGVPDDCEVATAPFTAASGVLSPIGNISPQTWLLEGVPLAITHVTLHFEASADLQQGSESINVWIEGTGVGQIFSQAGFCSNPPDEQDLAVSVGTFNDAAADGVVEILMMPSASVSTLACGFNFISVSINYVGFDLTQDCNGNGIPDDCETDCNLNGVPDDCDIAGGTSQDDNGDAIPDECECPWDLNGDGVVNVLDLIELVMSFGPCEGCPADFNDDGFVNVLDLIALIMNFGPCPGTPCVWDVNGDGVVDQSDVTAVTSNLGPCDGCPEDVNGDGVVNGQDAAAVATHFGPCP